MLAKSGPVCFDRSLKKSFDMIHLPIKLHEMLITVKDMLLVQIRCLELIDPKSKEALKPETRKLKTCLKTQTRTNLDIGLMHGGFSD
jgi:hypothetical protein